MGDLLSTKQPSGLMGTEPAKKRNHSKGKTRPALDDGVFTGQVFVFRDKTVLLV